MNRREKRAERKTVCGIAPHTPNRKCIGQQILEKDGQQRVFYYHVTKGWKSRRMIDVSFHGAVQALSYAQARLGIQPISVF